MAHAVDRQAGLAVIQAADHHVHPPEDPQAQVGRDVALQVLDLDLRVELLGPGRHHRGLAALGVRFPEQHRTGEVGRFHRVEIDHVNVADPHQGQVLDHLVAQGSRADHQNFGGRHLIALPPGNEIKSAQAVRF